MAPPRQCRVLRCCSCGLFQAHQEKKSLKWTCKACGQKQSFLRAYGEGSGADCRRHVQKLNLLQGQVSEMSFRSPEAPTNSSSEETAGPQQGEHACPQEEAQPSENCWLKYLERDSTEPSPKGGRGCLKRPPSSRMAKPDSPFFTGLPRKRKWSQSRGQPPRSPDTQDSSDCEVTLEPQEEHAGLAGVRGGHRHEDWDTRELTAPPGEPPCPAQHARSTSSKWEPFLLTPANSPRVEKGLPRTQTPREGHLSRPLHVSQLPGATHSSASWGIDPLTKGVSGTRELLPMQLHDLFTTGEDFNVNLWN
nr:MRN complex-interacting protein isoform X2 [Manis javanica]